MMRGDGTSPGSNLVGSSADERSGGLYVCPLSRVRDTVAESGARHLITLVNRQGILERPAGIEPANHLWLAFSDIVAPQEGMVHPCEEHVHELIRFARGWNGRGPMVVHCWAGISRSTAAAFITLCTLNPNTPELHIALTIREASLTACPNRLLVSLADDMLGRQGRMVSAVEEMGPAAQASEAQPFMLSTIFA